MSDKMKSPVIVALGYFDSVHKGHLAVIERAISLAKKYSAVPLIFSFDGDLRSALKSFSGGCVFTKKERAKIFEKFSGAKVYFAPTTPEFLGMDKLSFLKFLEEKFNAIGYVFGEDYKFGSDFGDADFLTEYAELKNKAADCVTAVKNSVGEKISTTEIKRLLSCGKVELANENLFVPYFISGKVVKGRGVGKTLGFATANVEFSKEKFLLRFGVYYGSAVIDGKLYPAVINYGGKPTFGISEFSVEAHFIGYSGDLYGKDIDLTFHGYIREIKKFDSLTDLSERINIDVKYAEEKLK